MLKNTSQNINSEQRPLDHIQKSARDALKKEKKRAIRKSAETTAYKITDKITKSQEVHHIIQFKKS